MKRIPSAFFTLLDCARLGLGDEALRDPERLIVYCPGDGTQLMGSEGDDRLTCSECGAVFGDLSLERVGKDRTT